MITSFWTSPELLARVAQHTNKGQPNKFEAEDRNKSQRNPKQWVRVERNPEEPAIRRVDDLSCGVAALKDPVRIASLRINFVPPT